jgi:hypothetical protein
MSLCANIASLTGNVRDVLSDGVAERYHSTRLRVDIRRGTRIDGDILCSSTARRNPPPLVWNMMLPNLSRCSRTLMTERDEMLSGEIPGAIEIGPMNGTSSSSM